MSQTIGFAAEQYAQNYLCTQGLVHVTSNYRCKLGEIDLIMRDHSHLIFVEVRARTSASHGGATASITHHKQQKLIKTALFYLQSQQCLNTQACRFDVLTLDGTPPNINWIQNAFGLNY